MKLFCLVETNVALSSWVFDLRLFFAVTNVDVDKNDCDDSAFLATTRRIVKDDGRACRDKIIGNML